MMALAAGLAGGLQVAVMGRFGERIGTLEALAFSATLTAAVTLVVLVVARRSLDGLAAGWSSPVWLWLGGAMGAYIVLSITVAGPRIGVVATTALLIVGQLTAATLIDRFGWFGVDRIGLSTTKLVGLALLVVGAALTLRR